MIDVAIKKYIIAMHEHICFIEHNIKYILSRNGNKYRNQIEINLPNRRITNIIITIDTYENLICRS
jgi:hypothetical protein